jgi:molybdopterin-containing oxidoreductase family membrane subunit
MANIDATHPTLPPDQSLGDVTDQLARIPLHFPTRRRWLIALAIASLLLFLLFVSAFVLFGRGVGIWGLDIPVNWAFAIHNYVWWLGIGHAGTLISALLLLLGSDWRNSLNRFAETMTLFAVICAGIYPVLHLGRPWYVYWMLPYPATMDVWPQFRSPLEWDIWAVTTYLTVSVIFWYTGLIPDLAAARDRARRRGWQVFFGVLALGWRGSAMHWFRWTQSYRLLAALAVPLVVSVHSEVSLLFAASQIPGWHSTIFPPYFVLGAAFSGFAVVSIIAIALRALFHLENLVTDDHLDILGKVVLATGLMTAYGYVFEIFDAIYSGEPHELQTLAHRFTGAYAWTYWGAVIFNFVFLQFLWWRPVRRTPWMLLLISLSVVIGMWLERYMILVTSLYRDFLVSSWGQYTPTFWDWSTWLGTLGLFLVPFLLLIRLLPVIAISETKEQLHEEQKDEQTEGAHA